MPAFDRKGIAIAAAADRVIDAARVLTVATVGGMERPTTDELQALYHAVEALSDITGACPTCHGVGTTDGAPCRKCGGAR